MRKKNTQQWTNRHIQQGSRFSSIAVIRTSVFADLAWCFSQIWSADRLHEAGAQNQSVIYFLKPKHDSLISSSALHCLTIKRSLDWAARREDCSFFFFSLSCCMSMRACAVRKALSNLLRLEVGNPLFEMEMGLKILIRKHPITLLGVFFFFFPTPPPLRSHRCRCWSSGQPRRCTLAQDVDGRAAAKKKTTVKLF